MNIYIYICIGNIELVYKSVTSIQLEVDSSSCEM